MGRIGRCVAAAGVVAVLTTVVAAEAFGLAAGRAQKVITSRSFAGWLVNEPTKHISSATVTFVVPKITCHKRYSAVGPSILIDSTVTHNTYTYSGGGIAVTCENNAPVYVALPIVDGDNYDDYNVTISAGDKVTVTVHYGAKTTVTLTDDTTGQVDKHVGKRSLGASAFFGDTSVQINHHSLGLDSFTKTAFSAAKVNGRAIGRDTPQRYEWVDKHKVVLVTASKLTDNDAFTTTFQHSS